MSYLQQELWSQPGQFRVNLNVVRVEVFWLHHITSSLYFSRSLDKLSINLSLVLYLIGNLNLPLHMHWLPSTASYTCANNNSNITDNNFIHAE